MPMGYFLIFAALNKQELGIVTLTLKAKVLWHL